MTDGAELWFRSLGMGLLKLLAAPLTLHHAIHHLRVCCWQGNLRHGGHLPLDYSKLTGAYFRLDSDDAIANLLP